EPGVTQQITLVTFFAPAVRRDDRGKVREMKHFSGILEAELPRPVKKGADQRRVVIFRDVRSEVHPCLPGFGQEGFDRGHRLRMIPEMQERGRGQAEMSRPPPT